MVRSNLRLKKLCKSSFQAGYLRHQTPGRRNWRPENHRISLWKMTMASSMPTWMDRTGVDLRPKAKLLGLAQWDRTSE